MGLGFTFYCLELGGNFDYTTVAEEWLALYRWERHQGVQNENCLLNNYSMWIFSERGCLLES
jgi:hypothetical protein